jgi:DNA-binding transcriptional ArsR family regulator
MSFDQLRSFAPAASRLLKAMGNPHRLTILCDLSRGEFSVKELETHLGLSQSALSQHLARLRQEKLVQTRRDRQTIYYSLRGATAEMVMRALTELYHPRSLPSAGTAHEARGDSP